MKGRVVLWRFSSDGILDSMTVPRLARLRSVRKDGLHHYILARPKLHFYGYVSISGAAREMIARLNKQTAEIRARKASLRKLL